MLRLYLRFYLALLASLFLLGLSIMALVHFTGASWAGFHARLSLHVATMVMAVMIGLAAFPIVRQISRRLERLQRGVESLGAGDLTARVSVEGRDEVAQLATAFNHAASRIEQLVGAHKALLANASHELSTPLARIRLAVELMKEATDAKRRAGLEQDIAELDQLVDEILLASRLDAVPESALHEELDLLALAAEECARYEEANLEGTPVLIRGDPRLLRRLLRNLLENARRHGAPPTQVRIAAEVGLATLTVWDNGPGVTSEEFDAVFRPFYRRAERGSSGAARDERVDAPSHNSSSSGTGLGLALVRQIARRHGGEARCALHNGRCCFIVTLPK
jgi:signal transduction histidine kinase